LFWYKKLQFYFTLHKLNNEMQSFITNLCIIDSNITLSKYLTQVLIKFWYCWLIFGGSPGHIHLFWIHLQPRCGTRRSQSSWFSQRREITRSKSRDLTWPELASDFLHVSTYTNITWSSLKTRSYFRVKKFDYKAK
jgi:hypothetical protein